MKLRNIKMMVKKLTNFEGIDVRETGGDLPCKNASMCYNFLLENNALVKGNGVNPLYYKTAESCVKTQNATVPFKEFYIYKKLVNGNQTIYFLARSGDKIYDYQYGGTTPWKWVEKFKIITGKGNYCNYFVAGENCLLLNTFELGMYVYNATETLRFYTTPKIKKLILHKERCFGLGVVEPYRMYFSDDFDPRNWESSIDKGGFIDFPVDDGRLLKLISFKNYLYIIRENGIYKMSTYGEQTDFQITKVFVSTGKIYEETVCDCGEKIIFVASDGMYVFDGYTSQKVYSELDNMFENIKGNLNSAYFKGKYYLSFWYPFNKNDVYNSKNNILISVGVKKKSICISKDIEINYMTPFVDGLNEELVCLTGDANSNTLSVIDDSGLYFNNNIEGCWKSGNLDFDSFYNNKVVDEIIVNATGNLSVKVTCDGVCKRFENSATSEEKHFKINLKGKIFTIEIVSSDDKINVKDAYVKYYIVR